MPSSTIQSPSSSPTSSSSTTSPKNKRARVTAEHTLSRVRENQRRHRARRKDHIASLEQKLAETSAQLAAARAEIAMLQQERERETIARQTHITGQESMEHNIEPRLSAPEKAINPPLISNLALDFFAPLQTAPHVAEKEGVGDGLETEIPALEKLIHPSLNFFALDTASSPSNHNPNLNIAIPATSTPPCCDDPDPSPVDRTPSPECSSCHTRPAPAPTETTTLCTQAFVLIAAQNYCGIDLGTIRVWLYPGYRRAQHKGEGCRVENGVLFRVLDWVSGV